MKAVSAKGMAASVDDVEDFEAAAVCDGKLLISWS